MLRMTNSFSLWALVAFIALLALQSSPVTGDTLMFLVGGVCCGFAAQAFCWVFSLKPRSEDSPAF